MTERIKISDRTIMYREKAPMQPRCITRPECGYWAVRLTAGGAEVGACIRFEQTTAEPGHPTNLMERSPILTARLDGEVVPLDQVWLRRGREISLAEYQFLIADRAWARRWSRGSPEANPTRKADLRALPPVMPPKRTG